MILFILFLAMFSLDVFDMEGTLLAKLGGFVVHSIPSIALTAALAVLWRKPLIMGVIDFALAAAYTAFAWSRGNPQWALGLALPLAVVGALFVRSHFMGRNAAL
jgi:hypothetical protein